MDPVEQELRNAEAQGRYDARRAAILAVSNVVLEPPYDEGLIHGRKLMELERYFLRSLGPAISRAMDIFPTHVLKNPYVRAAVIEVALSDQGPDIPDHTVWELIAENDWIARIDNLGELAGADGDLEGAAHDFLAEALRRHLDEHYEDFLKPRESYDFRRKELDD